MGIRRKENTASKLNKVLIAFVVDFMLLFVGTVIFAGVALLVQLEGTNRVISLLCGAVAVLVFVIVIGCFQFHSLAKKCGGSVPSSNTQAVFDPPLRSAGRFSQAIAFVGMFCTVIVPACFTSANSVDSNNKNIVAEQLVKKD